MEKIQKLAQAIQLNEGWKEGTRSYRNNNPGNIKYTDYSVDDLGAIGKDDGGFAIFANYEDGFNAVCQLVEDAAMGRLFSYKPDMTFLQFINVYAGNPNPNYAPSCANAVGLSLNDPIKHLLTKEIETYSQHDPRWAGLSIGNGATMSSHGCYIAAFAMILQKRPDIVLAELKQNGCLTADGLMISEKAAALYGLTYNKQTEHPGIPCIAETDDYKKRGYPQHFYLSLDTETRVDPLDNDPYQEHDRYNVVSYRVYMPPAIENETDTTTLSVRDASVEEKTEEKTSTPFVMSPISLLSSKAVVFAVTLRALLLSSVAQDYLKWLIDSIGLSSYQEIANTLSWALAFVLVLFAEWVIKKYPRVVNILKEKMPEK